jgi:hypothetical protein
MGCPKCYALRAEHRRGESSYLQANQKLVAVAAVTPVEEYALLRTITIEAGIDSELARLELESHQRWQHTIKNLQETAIHVRRTEPAPGYWEPARVATRSIEYRSRIADGIQQP